MSGAKNQTTEIAVVGLDLSEEEKSKIRDAVQRAQMKLGRPVTVVFLPNADVNRGRIYDVVIETWDGLALLRLIFDL